MNKIDLIIDALEMASHVPRGVMYPAGYHMQIAQALAAARELKALKPVGIRYNYFGTVVSPYSDGLFDRLEKYPDIELQKLYALDEVTKLNMHS
jgi:hypothetical protein